ncbi:hypothetical protein HOLleu_23392 [Holothuria leucospilota]|uniref:Uncharacterized protein n=1 Tax=Holothuria leucospilota TaxID=206669 RepID=A0A9Q1H569_HOLLE|nr:hypothetical protein HOLleu_23392 [Holothuria leucospilota]
MDFKTGEEAKENCMEPDAEDTQKKSSSRLEGNSSLPGSRSWSKLSCQTLDKEQQTDEVESGPQNVSSEREEGTIKETKHEKEEGLTEKEKETEDEPEVIKETELDKETVIELETAVEAEKEEEIEQEKEESEKNEEPENEEPENEESENEESENEESGNEESGNEESGNEESGNEESGKECEEEETEVGSCKDNSEESVEKEIEHFPKIHNDGLESDTFSEVSVHVPRVTIAERIRQLSSESQLSLKAWQDADKRNLRGRINATRSHPNCFSQNHLENITSSRTVGRYKQGETIPSAGVRTVIFWSNERERSNDVADDGNRSHLWASSMNMYSRQGRPVRNLQSVHSCIDRKTDRPQSHEFCSCNRFVDHHNAYFQTLRQKARTASFPGFHIFQTELDEDDELSFRRNPNLSPKLAVGFGPKRNNTPVVPIRRQRTNFSPKQSYNSFSGHNFGRAYPLTSRSRDSFSLRSSSWETSTYSPPQVSPRHPPMPSIISLKSRKPASKPLDKSFNDMIRGTRNFVPNESV